MGNIKVKDLIGPEIKTKDTVAMGIKAEIGFSGRAVKTIGGGGITGIKAVIGTAADAVDPNAKDELQKFSGEIAAGKELERELQKTNRSLKPATKNLRMEAEKKIFKKTAAKPLKTRTAFSPLLYRRQEYNKRYKQVKNLRRAEYIRRFMLPAKKKLQNSKIGKKWQRVKNQVEKKAEKIVSKKAVHTATVWIKQIAEAMKAVMAAIVAVGGAAVAIPLIAALILFATVPALYADANAAGSGIFASPYGKTPYTVTAEFGTRIDPFTGKVTQHDGYDVCAVTGEGSPIYAVYDGKITAAYDGSKTETGYGSYVILGIEVEDTQEKLEVLYGHLSGFVVKKGDKVQAGQLIGFEGSTGRSTGSHLHFEVRLGGEPIDGSIYWDI